MILVLAIFLFIRYFMASKLRKIFPFLWSNSVPHCDVMSPSYEQAWAIMASLYAKNSNFVNECKCVKDCNIFTQVKTCTTSCFTLS